jgi:hypothetical protein
VIVVLLVLACKFLQSRQASWGEDESDAGNPENNTPLDGNTSVSLRRRYADDEDCKLSHEAWVDLFFWSQFIGCSKSGKFTIVGKALCVGIFCYASVKGYMMLTLSEQLQIKKVTNCKFWIVFAYSKAPHLPEKDPAQYAMLVRGAAFFLCFRSALICAMIFQLSKITPVIPDQFESTWRYQKQTQVQQTFLGSRRFIDKLQLLIRHFGDMWALGSFYQTSIYYDSITVTDVIATGKPLFFANMVCNSITTYALWMWVGVAVSFSIQSLFLCIARVEMVMNEIATLPSEEINPQQHAVGIAKKIRDIHHGIFRTKTIGWEIVIAQTILLIAANLVTDVWIAHYMGPLLKGETAVRNGHDWDYFIDSFRSLVTSCFLGMCFMMAMPVFVNKKCDRMCQRINDLLLHWTTCNITDTSVQVKRVFLILMITVKRASH